MCGFTVVRAVYTKVRDIPSSDKVIESEKKQIESVRDMWHDRRTWLRGPVSHTMRIFQLNSFKKCNLSKHVTEAMAS